MLADDAFLRQLPSGIAPEQAVLIETLVYCADAVETSYDTIRLTALTHGDQVANTLNRSARVRMFIDAWTIVDCVHVARQVMQALAYPTAAAAAFQTKYEIASKLRNKMDHVVGQARNHSNRKDQPPLLGMISYCYDNLEQTDTGYTLADACTIFAISHGHIRSRATMDAIMPMKLPTPVVYKEEFEQFGQVAHGFHLSAFEAGLVFPLEAAAHDMAALIEEVNALASRLVPEQLQKLADGEGVDVEELMRPTRGDLVAWFKFERTAEATQLLPNQSGGTATVSGSADDDV
jgi:hypothetical protein